MIDSALAEPTTRPSLEPGTPGWRCATASRVAGPEASEIDGFDGARYTIRRLSDGQSCR